MRESEKWKWSRLSRVWLLATPWTAAYQAPASMGFSRQEYWSGVPLPSPHIHTMEYYSAIEKNKPLIHTTMGLPCGSDGKESPLMRDIWVWSLVRKMPWRRERLPTPVLWAGEFHGLYIPWDCKEPDTTEQLSLSHNYETEFHKHYGMTEAKPQRIIFCWYEVLELS